VTYIKIQHRSLLTCENIDMVMINPKSDIGLLTAYFELFFF